MPSVGKFRCTLNYYIYRLYSNNQNFFYNINGHFTIYSLAGTYFNDEKAVLIIINQIY